VGESPYIKCPLGDGQGKSIKADPIFLTILRIRTILAIDLWPVFMGIFPIHHLALMVVATVDAEKKWF